MRERLRGTGPRTTVARAARLLNRSARACPSHASQKPLRLIKVLTDLVILFLLRVYRHSGPIGPETHPVHPAHPGHPASDTQTQQDGEKVWKTLMSIEPHPRQGEKVREDLNSYSHPGADCFWRRGAIILFILHILAILLQTTKTRCAY